MRADTITAIDCDVHPAVADIKQLLPHLEPYWRDSFAERGIPGFESNAYPPNAPLSARPDFRGKNGRAATSVAELTAHVFERDKASIADSEDDAYGSRWIATKGTP